MKLENYFITNGMAWGNIHGDEKGRFPDGSFIRTSEIEKEYSENGKHYIKTRNSVYELGAKAGEVNG